MKPFEIFSWQPAGWPEPHLAVIVSHASRAGHKPVVEVLMCATQKAGRAAQPGEMLLDEADGLEWPTICKCDLIYAVPRLELKNRRGQISPARRAQLIRTLIAAHAWGEMLTG